jgi:DNA-binding transcriptional MerR regulator
MQLNQLERSHGHVNVSEAAARAGVSRQAVHKWIAHGRLHPHASDDGYLLDVEELARFLAVREASSEVGIRVDTLRHWLDDAGELSSP